MPKLHLVRLMRERIAQLGNKAALRVQQDGQWRAIGWRTLGQAMDYCAQALIRAGHQPTEMVGIYARNMPEWTQADLGILAARGVSVPIYPTSTLDQLRYIVKDAGIKVLFVGEQPQFDQALQLIESGEIRQLIALDGNVNLRGCEQASHFQTFLVSGNHQPSEQELRVRETQYRMDDLLTLIYTSGTTGEPKGVMLDFSNIAACFEMHNSRLDLNQQDVSLCMLPLSHVFERAWSYYVLYCGAENVYIRDPQKVMDVIGEVQPTVMCAVPRLYEKAYAMIQAKVAQAPALRRALFGWATKVGKQMVATRQAGKSASPLLYGQLWLAERLVFRKLRARFGGRTRFLPVAGARLADDVNLFFQAMGLNLKYGYGMTETTATVCCYEDSQFKLGSIGTALNGIEVKLGENNELLVRSPTVMRGYYNKPDATAEVMTEDGFLRTGDAGELDSQGNIYFTERLKELMKTSNGKYVAPAAGGRDHRQGSLYRADRHRRRCPPLRLGADRPLLRVAGGVRSLHQPAVPVQDRAAAPLPGNGVLRSPHRRSAKRAGQVEQVKKFTLLPSAFSMELGELTPTMKLRRKIIEAKYQSEIEAMYNHV